MSIMKNKLVIWIVLLIIVIILAIFIIKTNYPIKHYLDEGNFNLVIYFLDGKLSSHWITKSNIIVKNNTICIIDENIYITGDTFVMLNKKEEELKEILFKYTMTLK